MEIKCGEHRMHRTYNRKTTLKRKNKVGVTLPNLKSEATMIKTDGIKIDTV